jgi:hypothetical protein
MSSERSSLSKQASKRVITSTLARDEVFHSCSEFAQLLYLMMLAHTDSEGRIRSSATWIRATVLPLSKRELKDVVAAIVELCDSTLLTLYLDNQGNEFLQYKANTFKQLNAVFVHRAQSSDFAEPCRAVDVQAYVMRQLGKRQRVGRKVADTKMPKDGGYSKVLAQQEAIDGNDSPEARLVRYILTTLPRVAAMPRPLTLAEAKRLLEIHSKPDIQQVLESMENYRGLNKYTSTYLTASTWLTRSKRSKQDEQRTQKGARHAIDSTELTRLADEYDKNKR